MNNDPYGIQYSPERRLNWGNVQFADYDQVQVADFTKVSYYEPENSELEEEEESEGEGDTEPQKDDDEVEGKSTVAVEVTA